MARSHTTKAKINVNNCIILKLSLNTHNFRLDYGKFGLETPDFGLCDEIEDDLNKQEHIWGIFEEFSKGLEQLSNEEWIVFRKKMYRLDEFLLFWKEKLQNETNSALASRILQEIHKYEVKWRCMVCQSNPETNFVLIGTRPRRM